MLQCLVACSYVMYLHIPCTEYSGSQAGANNPQAWSSLTQSSGRKMVSLLPCQPLRDPSDRGVAHVKNNELAQ